MRTVTFLREDSGILGFFISLQNFQGFPQGNHALGYQINPFHGSNGRNIRGDILQEDLQFASQSLTDNLACGATNDLDSRAAEQLMHNFFVILGMHGWAYHDTAWIRNTNAQCGYGGIVSRVAFIERITLTQQTMLHIVGRVLRLPGLLQKLHHIFMLPSQI